MAIRQRLHPDAGQLEVTVQRCADARFVWDLALEQWSMLRRDKAARGVFTRTTLPGCGTLKLKTRTGTGMLRQNRR